MKNKRIATYLCIAAVLTVTGCASPEAQPDKQSSDIIHFNDATGIETQDNGYKQPQSDTTQEQPGAEQAATAADNTYSDSAQSDAELDGVVESIGDSSIVINKIFHESEEIDVVYQDSGKELITVSFSEETKFEVWTVKNGGVNGDSDVEKQQGTFSDLNEQGSVKLAGSYEGDDFHATQVIIYRFV